MLAGVLVYFGVDAETGLWNVIRVIATIVAVAAATAWSVTVVSDRRGRR